MKNYVLAYLGTRTKLPGYVQQALVQLYARLTKIGWNEGTKSNYPFRSVTQDLGKFLQVKSMFFSWMFNSRPNTNIKCSWSQQFFPLLWKCLRNVMLFPPEEQSKMQMSLSHEHLNNTFSVTCHPVNIQWKYRCPPSIASSLKSPTSITNLWLNSRFRVVLHCIQQWEFN